MNLLTLMLLGGLSLFAEAKDANPRFNCHGPSTKQAVLLIHGSPGSAADWNPLLRSQILKKEKQVITFDRQGYGEARNLRAAKTLSEQLPLLKKALSCNRASQKPIVVGYSYGGALAVLFALENPELIERLILLAPALSPVHEKLPWFKRPGLNPVIHRFLPQDWKTSLIESDPLPTELREMQPRLKNLFPPVDYLQGTDDTVVNVKTAAYARNHIPKINIRMIPGLDHMIPEARPDLILALILE